MNIYYSSLHVFNKKRQFFVFESYMYYSGSNKLSCRDSFKQVNLLVRDLSLTLNLPSSFNVLFGSQQVNVIRHARLLNKFTRIINRLTCL